jgi:hypothetical protein
VQVSFERILAAVAKILFLAFSLHVLLQTSAFQVRNTTTGASMSLIKKSDVKSHLSATNTSVYPFGLKRSDKKTTADGKGPGGSPKAADISVSPSQPISPGAVPNTQVGGSVGVPADTAKSGKRSW